MYAGSPSLAPKVSEARTANPSMVERAKVGRSPGESTAQASTRSSASAVSTSSTCSAAGKCSSSVRSASGGVRTLNSSVLVMHVGDAGPGDAQQGLRSDREHRVRRTRGSPDLVVLEQVAVQVGRQRYSVPDGWYAADGKAGDGTHLVGVGAFDGRADERLQQDGVDAVRARDEDQDGLVTGHEDQRFDDALDRRADSGRGLCCRGSGVRKLANARLGDAQRGKRGDNTLHRRNCRSRTDVILGERASVLERSEGSRGIYSVAAS